MSIIQEISPDANVEAIREELLERSRVGLKKYGVTTERPDIDLKGWIQHLKEELLDAAVYCQALNRRLDLLERLFRLFYSYNPDLPMGPGLKAEFLAIRNELDALSDLPT